MANPALPRSGSDFYLLCLSGSGGLRIVRLMTSCIAFTNAGSFPAQSAKVVKFCASNATFLNEIDVVDDRRMEGKDPLNADAKARLSDRDRLASATVLSRDDNTLESLEPFFRLRLFNSDMHTHGIARLEPRKVLS